MMTPTPTLNRAYSLINDHESRRALTNSHVKSVTDGLEGAVFFSNKGGSNLRGNYGKAVVIGGSTSHDGAGTSHGGGNIYSASHGGGSINSGHTNFGGNYFNRQPSNNTVRPPWKHTLVCEFCSYNGHTKENCYKLIGYPPDWPKSKKKVGGQFA